MREDDLLEYVYGRNAGLPHGVVIRPGDDMGAVQVGGQTVLATVDQVVDGVHVKTTGTPLEQVGHKAMVRSLSDVAAMAAVPVGALVAACLPRSFSCTQARRLFSAMAQTADRYDCPLFGGDICIADGPLALTVTVLAEPGGIEPVRRSGAQAGDMIYVTGRLGGAWDRDGGGAHLSAEPRIAHARFLAKILGQHLHSMIDLSDGLVRDLGHICRLSRLDGLIVPSLLPMRLGPGDAAVEHALYDGEDYELCFTVAAEAEDRVPDHIQDLPVTRIGTMAAVEGDSPTVRLTLEDGTSRPCRPGGWEHGNA